MSATMTTNCSAVTNGATCNGTIDADGFCERCGAQAGPALPAATLPTMCMEEAKGGRICGGTIDADGFCERCGHQAVAAAASPAPAAGPTRRDHSSQSIFDDVVGSERSVTAREGSLAAGSSAYLGREDSGDSQHSSSQTGLGVGLIMMPPAAIPAPEQSVLPAETLADMVRQLEAKPDALVPEEKRFCPGCGNKVSLLKGFCGRCRKPYSFSLEPRLKKGDVAGGDYDVLGPMARGGNGWVTLARDRNLDTLVVLKSMIRNDNPGAVQGAINERKFLGQMDHSRIARIHRFFEEAGVGYMVMEYAGGPTLGQLRDKGVMDVLEGCSYVYAALSTTTYLRGLGISNPDNKPDNVIRVKNDIKVVDAGAMRLLADKSGKRVTVTRGYAPPEALGHDLGKPWRGVMDPYVKRDINITTDCYTMGRTLMRLIMDFEYSGRRADTMGRHEFSVPSPVEQKVLARHESLYRFLLRAIHADPALRFQHPEEMRGQLLGVMRDLAASRNIDVPPFESETFTKEGWPGEQDALDPGDAFLAAIKSKAGDRDAQAIAAATLLQQDQRSQWLLAEVAKRPKSADLGVRAVEAQIVDGDLAGAARTLEATQAQHRLDWRMLWLRGRLALLRGEHDMAIRAFDDVTAELPGELAPRLAAGVAYLRKGSDSDVRIAATLFSSVARVDRAVVNALFGLAACYARQGNLAAVVEAMRRVPSSSHLYTLAQARVAESLADDASLPFEQGLGAASEIVLRIGLAGQKLHLLRARLLEVAVGRVRSSKSAAGAAAVFGVPMEDRALRKALAAEYRACGRAAVLDQDRWEFVHRAHQVQPPALFAW